MVLVVIMSGLSKYAYCLRRKRRLLGKGKNRIILFCQRQDNGTLIPCFRSQHAHASFTHEILREDPFQEVKVWTWQTYNLIYNDNCHIPNHKYAFPQFAIIDHTHAKESLTELTAAGLSSTPQPFPLKRGPQSNAKKNTFPESWNRNMNANYMEVMFPGAEICKPSLHMEIKLALLPCTLC